MNIASTIFYAPRIVAVGGAMPWGGCVFGQSVKRNYHSTGKQEELA